MRIARFGPYTYLPHTHLPKKGVQLIGNVPFLWHLQY